MRLALFEPEIPQNTGTLLRLGACLGVCIDIIEPCGFIMNERRMRRAGMDYISLATMKRHTNWTAFYQESEQQNRRLVLIDPAAPCTHIDFKFHPDDTLLLGRESSGFSPQIHRQVPLKIRIPMVKEARSLNVAIAGALVLGEALRQVKAFSSFSDLSRNGNSL